ncbi:unnamed protein product, partial [Vitis vinifera]
MNICFQIIIFKNLLEETYGISCQFWMPPTLEIFPFHPSEYAYQVYLTQVHSHIASLIYDLQRFCMKEAFHCIPLHPPDLQSIVSNKSNLDSSSPIRKKSEYPQFMSSLDAQLRNDPKNNKLRKPSSSLNSQMGFMNVLKFSAACFDLLGWPLCALGYPLCASIRAIETNSISDFRKLVAYWVLFSLISLFDHAFSKLLEWVPFWPYIKLMVICWLVIQQFDGSYYVYQHLVQPCLSMDPQAVMNWLFNESKKKFHSRENFLVSADRYIKENGPEALEKLLSRKLRSAKPNVEVKKIKAPAAPEKKGEQWKCEEPNVAQKEIQVVKVTEIKNGGDGAKRCEWPNAAKKEVKVTEVTHRTFGGTAQWVKRTEINLGETRSNTTCAVEIKERAAALVAAEIEACRDDRTPKIPLHEKGRDIRPLLSS